MQTLLKKLNAGKGHNCLTIALNTHRTRPDNLQDSITLKNLLKEAASRVRSEVTKQSADKLLDHLDNIASSIDHNYNLESLVLFANEDMADFVRLPIKITQRVQLDQSFATRDLIRAIHFETNYYILVLSQHKVRLLEATNDTLLSEIGNPFPIQNTELHPESRKEKTDSARQSRLLAEYFNRVDKEVQNIWKNKPRPILICADENNRVVYESIADRKEILMATILSGNKLDEKAQNIVTDAWGKVKDYMAQRQLERKAELDKNIGSGNFLSDEGEIWRAIHEGKVSALFIEETKAGAGVINGLHLSLLQSTDSVHGQHYVDDIYDEMVEAVYAHGGETIFLPEGTLAHCQGMAAITRY